MDIKCRACLATTEAKMYHSLSTIFPEYMKTSLTVLDLLEVVTSTNVNMSYSLPNSICTACLKQVKDCYNFIEQFKNAQSWLQENFSEEIEAQPKNIIVKVEAIDEKFSSPVILDMEGNDIYQTGLEDEQIEEYKGEKILNQKRAVKRLRAKTPIRARKKRESERKINVSRPIKRNNDGIILMSIEDVLKENENTEDNENLLDSKTNYDSESDEKNCMKHNDHTYQKNSETSNNPNSSFFVMSVKDVLHSSTRIMVARSSGIKKRTKGIITQSADLIKNLERKTELRRAQKQTAEDEQVRTFVCDICLKVYESQKRLVAHKYGVHYPQWHEKFKCPICGIHCKTRSAFQHHKLKHKGKQFNCDLCEKLYLTKTQLNEHKRRIHGDGVPAKFLCTQCGKRFKFHAGLKYHVISAHFTDSKPYMCRYCGFKCVQKSYMNRHERCHTDERPYKCKFCDRTFRGTAELSTHHLAHEGKHRYRCKFCNKGFIQSWNLKVHSLQHGGDYDCEICNRNFIEETVLKFHYFHHHKIRDGGKGASEDTNSNDEQENLDSMFFATDADDMFNHELF